MSHIEKSIVFKIYDCGKKLSTQTRSASVATNLCYKTLFPNYVTHKKSINMLKPKHNAGSFFPKLKFVVCAMKVYRNEKNYFSRGLMFFFVCMLAVVAKMRVYAEVMGRIIPIFAHEFIHVVGSSCLNCLVFKCYGILGL